MLKKKAWQCNRLNQRCDQQYQLVFSLRILATKDVLLLIRTYSSTGYSVLTRTYSYCMTKPLQASNLQLYSLYSYGHSFTVPCDVLWQIWKTSRERWNSPGHLCRTQHPIFRWLRINQSCMSGKVEKKGKKKGGSKQLVLVVILKILVIVIGK